MVELSTFIGQIISDIATARTNADGYAASTSELYHADPFVKNLPIPHYIIESAEVDVPVMIVGITKSSDEFEGQKEQLFNAIKTKLPILLIRTYKYFFAKSREDEKQKEAEENRSREKMRIETNGAGDKKKQVLAVYYNASFTDEQLEEFASSSKQITEKMVVNIKNYLDSYNYDIVKILELSDEFKRCLEREIKLDVSTYKKGLCPFAEDDAVVSAAKYVGNMMFFEFKKIMRSNAAVQVDTNTVQMNEYATKDCLMHIKLKVKEQDLSLIVEEGENGREKRYLSLS
ncbi:MAG: hypothetical protein K2L12_02400 [Clostridia bacterium]|nr:hypothetical protein [Clostridia bacterium]